MFHMNFDMQIFRDEVINRHDMMIYIYIYISYIYICVIIS